ncbi:YetF domain-containing protein [Luteococcus sp. Sow4_B9]|uniref:YetF domain-containing protein n=1 Tax=Luteococcus sp. Sow4_B9 TaxID=3438792 RepID=UPI003F9D5EC3
MDGASGFWQAVWWQLGIGWPGVFSVVVSSTVLYVCFALVVHLSGPKLTARPSVLSFSVMALLGALCARGMLGNSPTLAGSLLAVAVLLVLEALLGRVRWAARRAKADGGKGHRAVVVMVDGIFCSDVLHDRRLTEAQLLARLRMEGLLSRRDAALVILERRGGLTVVKRGQRIERALLHGVRGADRIPEDLVL